LRLADRISSFPETLSFFASFMSMTRSLNDGLCLTIEAVLNAGRRCRKTCVRALPRLCSSRRAGSVEWTAEAALVEQPGQFIGPYKLIERIGEGGYGVVYRAEQEKPIRRFVALKSH
jgi:serine/threonine protein kinase